jgi:hypothetical protein
MNMVINRKGRQFLPTPVLSDPATQRAIQDGRLVLQRGQWIKKNTGAPSIRYFDISGNGLVDCVINRPGMMSEFMDRVRGERAREYSINQILADIFG